MALSCFLGYNLFNKVEAKHYVLLLKVQIKKWHYNGISTCPCAVAAREGNDLIVADMCHGQYKQSSLRFIIRSELPLHGHTKILQSNNGRSFTVSFVCTSISA